MSPARESARLRAWIASLDTVQKALFVVALILGLGSLALLASWRSTPEATATVPMPPESPGLAEIALPETPFAYDMIVEKNLFAPSRTAPTHPWGLSLAMSEAGETDPESPPASEGPPPHAAYRLQGTAVTGSRATTFALIEADPETPGPERYRIGDRVGPYRLLRIEATRAVLSGGVRLELGGEGAGQR